MAAVLRLVLIAPFACSPKSTTRARVLPLARALAGAGHEVTVLVPPYDNPAEGGRAYAFGHAKVESLAVDRHLREHSPRQAITQPRLAFRLARRALALNPDVVHVFKPKAVSGLTHLLLWLRGLARRRPPVVLDTDDWEGFGGWNDYEVSPRWQKLACDWQERWGLRYADAVTVASRTLEAQAWSYGVPRERVAYVPNGLAPEDYPGWRDADGTSTRARLQLGNRVVAGLYTRFFEFDPRRALDVLAGVERQLPGVRLLVIGGGKYRQEQHLVADARARGLEDVVRVTGWQETAALPPLLAIPDVFVFPSDDNLANRAKCSAKLLQTLWLGKAVVADRVGQQSEYVHHRLHGLLSDPAEPQTMIEATVELLKNRELASRLATAGHARVEREFNWPRLVGGVERAYMAAREAHH